MIFKMDIPDCYCTGGGGAQVQLAPSVCNISKILRRYDIHPMTVYQQLQQCGEIFKASIDTVKTIYCCLADSLEEKDDEERLLFAFVADALRYKKEVHVVVESPMIEVITAINMHRATGWQGSWYATKNLWVWLTGIQEAPELNTGKLAEVLKHFARLYFDVLDAKYVATVLTESQVPPVFIGWMAQETPAMPFKLALCEQIRRKKWEF